MFLFKHAGFFSALALRLRRRDKTTIFILVDPLLLGKIVSREMVNKNGIKVQRNRAKAAGRKAQQAKSAAAKPAGRRRNRTRRTRGTVEAPIAMSTAAVTSEPRIVQGSSSIRVIHKEFVANVSATDGFSISNAYSVNPGLGSSFPWLSQMASSWEQYRFRKLRYVFVSRSPTTVTGSVIMAPDYDAAEASPVSETQITAYQDAVEDVPWRDIVCTLRPASMHPMGPRKFVRNASMPGDVKTYDVANFFVAVDGIAAAVLGKLWVEYDVELSVPQIGIGEDLHPTTASQVLQSSAQTIVSTTWTPLLFDAPVLGYDPTGFFNQYNPATGAFIPPKGAWFVSYHGNFHDSDAENCSALVRLSETVASGGAPVNGMQANGTTAIDSSYDEYIALSFSGIFYADGATTYYVLAFIQGATGTLTTTAGATNFVAFSV